MSDIHITPDLLEAVERGDLPSRVLTEIGWTHLMNLCPTCRGGYRAWATRRRATPADYSTALQVLPLVLERHTNEAEKLQKAALKDFRQILKTPQEHRVAMINRAASRFRSLALVNMLLAEARMSIPAQPRTVQDLCVVTEAVLLRTPHAAGYFDALARIMAYRGNSLRALGNLPQADEYLKRARSLIRQQDITDTLVYAEVDWLEGVLRKDQRRFEEAEDLLIRAAALYHAAGEKVEAARPLLSLSAVYNHRQEIAKAIETTQAALENLHPKTETRLYCYARHNLSLFLCEAGRYQEAADSLLDHSELYEQCDDLYTQTRRTWLEGKIFFGLGRAVEAEQAFVSVRSTFLRQGNAYDVAMSSLDLALLYAKDGRASELEQIAEEMHAIFASQEIHREALSALIFFQEAVRDGSATVELITHLAVYLKRARTNPALRFR